MKGLSIKGRVAGSAKFTVEVHQTVSYSFTFDFIV